MRWCQRRHDRGHLGPGSRCPQRGCAASFERGSETSKASAPCGGLKIASESRNPRQGLLTCPSSTDDECGIIAAYTEECEQPVLARNGRSDLNLGVCSSFGGVSRYLALRHSRGRRLMAPGHFQPPGCEVNPRCRVSRRQRRASPARQGRAELCNCGRFTAIEESAL